MKAKTSSLSLLVMLLTAAVLAMSAFADDPTPPGKVVNLGRHRLHVNCTGNGSPTVVVENGLGDFSIDWTLVQSRVGAFTRICTYDRAGYAWSDPGPLPRSFSQINLELHDALAKLGEHGPFVLVGHSYGGPVVRNFAAAYPNEVAGMVQVDAAFEGMRVGIGGKKTIRLGEDAKGVSVPPPHEELNASDTAERPAVRAEDLPEELKSLDAMYQVLPEKEQKLHLWAQLLPGVYNAQNSETQWSGEFFAKWLAKPQAGALGKLPLIVLSRAEGGYRDEDSDIPAAQMEQERKAGQAMLVSLSFNSKQIVVRSGHNMNLEAPEAVSAAIRQLVTAIRTDTPL